EERQVESRPGGAGGFGRGRGDLRRGQAAGLGVVRRHLQSLAERPPLAGRLVRRQRPAEAVGAVVLERRLLGGGDSGRERSDTTHRQRSAFRSRRASTYLGGRELVSIELPVPTNSGRAVEAYQRGDTGVATSHSPTSYFNSK